MDICIYRGLWSFSVGIYYYSSSLQDIQHTTTTSVETDSNNYSFLPSRIISPARLVWNSSPGPASWHRWPSPDSSESPGHLPTSGSPQLIHEQPVQVRQRANDGRPSMDDVWRAGGDVSSHHSYHFLKYTTSVYKLECAPHDTTFAYNYIYLSL